MSTTDGPSVAPTARQRYHLLDVFTDRPFGGNPVAVFPRAEGVSERAMRAVAGELNLSETVFVLPPTAGGTARLRIFTPKMELPFAGHPTLGAAHLLVSLGGAGLSRSVDADGGADGEVHLVLEETSGPVPVTVRTRHGVPASARLTAPRIPELRSDAPAREEVAALLGLEVADVLDGTWSPRSASAGVPYLIVPVRDRGALARAQVDLAVWTRLLAPTWAPHLYVITTDVERAGSAVRARMFAPAMGIAEDPATGAAAAALAGYLSAIAPSGDGTAQWIVEQGFEMGRPSLLTVEAEVRGGAVAAVHVGGASVIIGEGVLQIPTDLQ